MFADEMACQKPWHRLFERLLSDWNERQGSDWDNAETRLPSSVYTCPQRYQTEVSTLFRRLPLCLGHVDQLAPGSVMTRAGAVFAAQLSPVAVCWPVMRTATCTCC